MGAGEKSTPSKDDGGDGDAAPSGADDAGEVTGAVTKDVNTNTTTILSNTTTTTTKKGDVTTTVSVAAGTGKGTSSKTSAALLGEKPDDAGEKSTPSKDDGGDGDAAPSGADDAG